MSQQTGADPGPQHMDQIRTYLLNKYGEEIAKKIIEKVADALGLKIPLDITDPIKWAFPHVKIAEAVTKFTTFGFTLLLFEGHYAMNDKYNPWHPKKDTEPYVQYLLYTWKVKGKPLYIRDPIYDSL